MPSGNLILHTAFLSIRTGSGYVLRPEPRQEVVTLKCTGVRFAARHIASMVGDAVGSIRKARARKKLDLECIVEAPEYCLWFPGKEKP
jgi:hypothetical protein